MALSRRAFAEAKVARSAPSRSGPEDRAPPEAQPPRGRARRSARRLAAGAAAAVVAAFAGGALAGSWLGSPGHAVELARQWGAAGGLVLVPLQAAVSLTFSPVPSDVVAVALGFLYGPRLGAALAWCAWMGAALVQYALARRASRGQEIGALLERLPRRLRGLPADHPAFLICARWLPLGPHVVNTAAGALRVPLGRFALFAALGIAPVAIATAALGHVLTAL